MKKCINDQILNDYLMATDSLELIESLFQQFKNKSEMLRNLDVSNSLQDKKKLQADLHAFNNSSSFVGAVELCGCLNQFEDLLIEDKDLPSDWNLQIIKHIDRATSALEELIAGYRSNTINDIS